MREVTGPLDLGVTIGRHVSRQQLERDASVERHEVVDLRDTGERLRRREQLIHNIEVGRRRRRRRLVTRFTWDPALDQG